MDLKDFGTLLAVHAHPDDESIGTGGILAKYADQGIKTVVVFCTRGEEGDILNPAFVPPSPGIGIKEIRKMELDRALKVLQVRSVFFLGYRDSGMAGTPTNRHPRAFAQADLEEAAEKLVHIIRQTSPQVMVTYNEKGTYGHPDHIMANRVTRRAFQAAGDPDFIDGSGLPPWQPSKLYYTAISQTRLQMMVQLAKERGEKLDFDPDLLGTPDERITTRVDVRPFLAQKMKAIACHESQFGPQSFIRRLPEEWREEAFGQEYFECVTGCCSGNEIDLFEGL
jgi:N-acetyl-1-D-myo-inositol-2-amino-2-deoxy-alpha-D-glucopyranoside deacetylase